MAVTAGEGAYTWIDKGLEFVKKADRFASSVTGMGLGQLSANLIAMAL